MKHKELEQRLLNIELRLVNVEAKAPYKKVAFLAEKVEELEVFQTNQLLKNKTIEAVLFRVVQLLVPSFIRKNGLNNSMIEQQLKEIMINGVK